MTVVANETLKYYPCDGVIITVYKGKHYEIIDDIGSGFWLTNNDDSFKMRIPYSELRNKYSELK